MVLRTLGSYICPLPQIFVEYFTFTKCVLLGCGNQYNFANIGFPSYLVHNALLWRPWLSAINSASRGRSETMLSAPDPMECTRKLEWPGPTIIIIIGQAGQEGPNRVPTEGRTKADRQTPLQSRWRCGPCATCTPLLPRCFGCTRYP